MVKKMEEEDDIKRMIEMAREDLAKPENKDLILNIGGIKLTKENIQAYSKEELKEIQEKLRETYFELINILEYYMDDTPENIMFYAIWIIGTYFHIKFYSYPYLFLNAMRGSGKSRLLKLISELGCGRYTSSVTEPIIFRTQGLLCIDELESIGGKDKQALRELLNASYKKGMTIMRTIKKKDITGETMKIEEFEPYRPLAMANIWGMDEVLGDRCITRILEKSNDPTKTKRTENFENNPMVKNIGKTLKVCSLCNVELKKKQELWNQYIDTIHNYTNYTKYTNYTNYIFSDKELHFFNKINETGIYGRNLELFLPIFIISDMIGEDVLDLMLSIGKKLNDEKRESELQESSDVMVYDFVSKQESSLEFRPIKELFYQFREFSQLEGDWVTDKWFGKALKRLNLTLEKKRKTKGIEVILNVAKAKEKLNMFKKEDDTPKL
jgi:hypothetical protein